jgi:hypothetical protein
MPAGIFVLGGCVEETHRKNEKERHILMEEGSGGGEEPNLTTARNPVLL